MPAALKLNYNIIYNYYIIQNLSVKDTAKKINCSVSSIMRFLKKYNIKKNTADFVKLRKQTCLKKYGVENPSQIEEIKKKKEQTCLKNYGTKFSFQNKQCKEKAIKTCIKRYGVAYVSQNKEIQSKIRKTCLKKYGVDVPAKSKKIREKMQNTCLIRYGVKSAMQINSIKEKVFKTKKLNKTINKSKEEDIIYNLLQNKFIDVKRQYRSKEYPFNCDFYIPALDLYIEYQGNWTHGKRSNTDITGPYNPINKKHEEILKTWIEKSKTSLAYKSAIKVWTINDPMKREIANKNNLNWIEFWTINQVKEWLIKLNDKVEFFSRNYNY